MSVTQLKTYRKGTARKVTVAPEAMNLLRTRLYEHHPSDVAEDTGLCMGTIYAIRSGRTIWPRPGTFFALLEYLGLELWITDKR
jgi:hypothetical protein